MAIISPTPAIIGRSQNYVNTSVGPINARSQIFPLHFSLQITSALEAFKLFSTDNMLYADTSIFGIRCNCRGEHLLVS